MKFCLHLNRFDVTFYKILAATRILSGYACVSRYIGMLIYCLLCKVQLSKNKFQIRIGVRTFQAPLLSATPVVFLYFPIPPLLSLQKKYLKFVFAQYIATSYYYK